MRILPLPSVRFCAALVAAVLFAGACGDDGGGGAADPDPPGVGSTAEVRSDDGALTVHVPASVDGEAIVATAIEPDHSFVLEDMESVDLGAFELTPDGAEFDEPLRLELAVEEEYDEDTSDYFAVSESAAHGVEVHEVAVEVVGGRVHLSIEVNHFSTFSFMKIGNALRTYRAEAFVDPQFWTMAVGETWEPPVVISSRRGRQSGLSSIWFEFQAITTSGSIVPVADTQVRCAEPGEGELEVHGILRMPVRKIDRADRQTYADDIDRGVLTRSVDAGAAVECTGQSSSSSDDEDTPAPSPVTLVDTRCVDQTGADTTGCADLDVLGGLFGAGGDDVIDGGGGFLGLAVGLAGTPLAPDDLFGAASWYFNTEGSEFSLACDGLDPSTFAPLPGDETAPCRLTLFDDSGLGTQLGLPPGSIPGVMAGPGRLVVDLDAPLFGMSDGVPVLQIPEGVLDGDGTAIPPGPLTIDTITGTVEHDGMFSIGQVDPDAFADLFR